MKKSIQINYGEGKEVFELHTKLASLAGFKNIGISFEKTSLKKEEAPRIAEYVNSICEKYEINCVQTHLPCYPDYESSEVFNDETEESIHAALRISGEIGAAWCVHHARNAVNSSYRTSAALEDNYRAISSYLETAEKYNTGIAVENLPCFAPVNFYTSNFSDLAELVDKFASPRVGVCWDTGHAKTLQYSQRAALRYLGSRVVCTHVHDNHINHVHNASEKEDLHLPITYGRTDWGDIAYGFADIGYDGPLTAETMMSYTWGKRYPDYLVLSFMKYNLRTIEYVEEIYNNARKEINK